MDKVQKKAVLVNFFCDMETIHCNQILFDIYITLANA